MSKKIQKEEIRYEGYFLMDSGLKIPFDISEEDGGENFSLYLDGNLEWPFEKGDVIWLGRNNELRLLTDKIIGWYIYEYKEKI